METKGVRWILVFTSVALVLGYGTRDLAAGEYDVSVGLKGGPNGTAVEKVPTGDVGGGLLHDPLISGGFGIGGAVGPILEFRAFDVVGFETGFHYSIDRANGETDITNRNRTIKQNQSVRSFRVPLLAKFTFPSETARPYLGLGLELVRQQSADFEYDPSRGTPDTEAVTSNYTLLQGTLGMEFDAGPVRIPVELRGGYHLGWDGSFERRIQSFDQSGGGVTGYEYVSDFQGHFGIFTGVIYPFSLGPSE